jgi:hypothetical protein
MIPRWNETITMPVILGYCQDLIHVDGLTRQSLEAAEVTLGDLLVSNHPLRIPISVLGMSMVVHRKIEPDELDGGWELKHIYCWQNLYSRVLQYAAQEDIEHGYVPTGQGNRATGSMVQTAMVQAIYELSARLTRSEGYQDAIQRMARFIAERSRQQLTGPADPAERI